LRWRRYRLHEGLNGVKIRTVAHQILGERGTQLRDLLASRGHSRLGGRMRGEKGLESGWLLRALVQQLLKERWQSFRIDPGAHGIYHTFGVGLRFVFLAVVCGLRIFMDANCYSTANRSARMRQCAEKQHSHLIPLSLLDLASGVPSHHVPDLVAHDARQLVETVRLLDRPSIHI